MQSSHNNQSIYVMIDYQGGDYICVNRGYKDGVNITTMASVAWLMQKVKILYL